MNEYSIPSFPVPVIGLYSSVAQSGKSTLADALVRDHGFVRVKMADGLKEMLRALLRTQGAPDSEIEAMLEGDKKEIQTSFLNGLTPRFAMQKLGHEWGRNEMGKYFWPNLAFSRILRFVSNGIPVVVDDVRYPSDATVIKDFSGGVMVRVFRLDKLGDHKPFYKRLFSRSHRSEGQLDKFDFNLEIHNDPRYFGVAEYQTYAVDSIRRYWVDVANRSPRFFK